MTEWIPTAQRMPEIDTPVLAIVNGNARIAITHMEYPTFEDTYQAFAYWDDPYNDGQCWEFDEVSHWTTLPEIPPALLTEHEL